MDFVRLRPGGGRAAGRAAGQGGFLLSAAQSCLPYHSADFVWLSPSIDACSVWAVAHKGKMSGRSTWVP